MQGLRVDVSKARRKLNDLREQIQAESFKPDLLKFAQASLKTAARETPVRNYALIKRNQQRQYNHRINYIPSYHQVLEPSLRVKDNGTHWLYFHGKWNIANGNRRLSQGAWSAYQQLLAERNRRMQTPRAPFIAERAQSRFLYRKSWSQVAQSLGLSINPAGNVTASHSRHNPPKAPKRGYGQLRGGKRVISVLIANPFLEEESQYKSFSGRTVLNAAMEMHEPVFQRRVRARLRRMIYAIMRA